MVSFFFLRKKKWFFIPEYKQHCILTVVITDDWVHSNEIYQIQA